MVCSDEDQGHHTTELLHTLLTHEAHVYIRNSCALVHAEEWGGARNILSAANCWRMSV